MAEPKTFSPDELANFKRAAAAHVAILASPGMAIGLGHGSTVAAVVPFLADRYRLGELAGTVFVPAAYYLAETLRRHDLPVASLDDWPMLDVAIDGADEVDGALDCIKGGGGALLYEKILAQAAARLVLVVDAGKISPRLGTHHAVPVEITPFALASEMRFLTAIGGNPALRRRPDGDPVRTERGNVLCDCAFGPLADAPALAEILNRRAGVAGHGLFVGLASEVVVGGPEGVRVLNRPGAPASGPTGPRTED